MSPKHSFLLIVLLVVYVLSIPVLAQYPRNVIRWTADGNGYYKLKEGAVVETDAKTSAEKIVVKKSLLARLGGNIAAFYFSPDRMKILFFTNTAKVWRYNTRGDYWILDIASGSLIQMGHGRPGQSLMYAKFSPDSKKVAYVSEHNLFVEDVSGMGTVQLTFDGTRKLINGTFDWVYEEEFDCRDGFRWSPDSRQIAFWQVDATKIRDYFMLNTTDSVYSQVIPVEYPKVGEAPSPVKVGVVKATGGDIGWMKVEGDPSQHYITRMEWADSATLVLQQLDRKQQVSKLFYCSISDGNSKVFYTETDNSWIETKGYWNDGDPTGWDWINGSKEFLWVSEKDGWRHIYKISRDGKKETLLTKGNYDISSVKCVDENSNTVYFMASPDNATQLYLYAVKMDGKSKAWLVAGKEQIGMHNYTISPNARWALHTFSSHKIYPVKEWVYLPDYAINNAAKYPAGKSLSAKIPSTVAYTTIITEDGISLDAWINKPKNFDSTKKYPVVFYVYGEPAASTVEDSYGNHDNFLYDGDMSADGYFQVSVDNRGTPSLKGAAWRKSIYRQIGRINIRDMAMAAKKILEKPYFDKDRVAVWGWSGGGSSTLNLMFQYPEIFKTGISISAVDNLLFYDNIYEERYMGLPQENKEDYINGSPVTYARRLEGNLLLIHGSGDDNVHYSNAEAMLNELIKYNKQVQFMAYPNRTHSLSEGEGTRQHLSTLYTGFIKKYCPPGPR